MNATIDPRVDRRPWKVPRPSSQPSGALTTYQRGKPTRAIRAEEGFTVCAITHPSSPISEIPATERAVKGIDGTRESGRMRT